MNADGLSRGLRNLSVSADKITALSQYMLMHYTHARQCVHTWQNVFGDANTNQILPLFYVANDVMQRSLAKGKDFVILFGDAMVPAFAKTLRTMPNLKSKLARLVSIWKSRRILSPEQIQTLENVLARTESNTEPVQHVNTATATSNKRTLDKSTTNKRNVQLPVYSTIVGADIRSKGCTVERLCEDYVYRTHVTTWACNKLKDSLPSQKDLAYMNSETTLKKGPLRQLISKLEKAQPDIDTVSFCQQENKSMDAVLKKLLQQTLTECEEKITKLETEANECLSYQKFVSQLSTLKSASSSAAQDAQDENSDDILFISSTESSIPSQTAKRTRDQGLLNSEDDTLAMIRGDSSPLLGTISSPDGKKQKLNEQQQSTEDEQLFTFDPTDPLKGEELVWNPVAREYQAKSQLLREDDWRD